MFLLLDLSICWSHCQINDHWQHYLKRKPMHFYAIYLPCARELKKLLHDQSTAHNYFKICVILFKYLYLLEQIKFNSPFVWCCWWRLSGGMIQQKSGLKTRGHLAIFWVLEVKRWKILQKLNKRDCFCLHSWLHFLWRFSRKNWFTQYIYDLTSCLAHFLNKTIY